MLCAESVISSRVNISDSVCSPEPCDDHEALTLRDLFAYMILVVEGFDALLVG
jgi:hypothetical protein